MPPPRSGAPPRGRPSAGRIPHQVQKGRDDDQQRATRTAGADPGYTYGTSEAAHSPLTLEYLARLKAAVGLTDDDHYLRMAAEVLADQADDMVTAWRAQLGEHPHLASYSAHPDGSPNPEYSAASKPRYDRWIIDACTRPLDQPWLDYQHEIGLRHMHASAPC